MVFRPPLVHVRPPTDRYLSATLRTSQSPGRRRGSSRETGRIGIAFGQDLTPFPPGPSVAEPPNRRDRTVRDDSTGDERGGGGGPPGCVRLDDIRISIWRCYGCEVGTRRECVGSSSVGKSSQELGQTAADRGCPDIWELDTGDVAVIGRDLTDTYRAQLPADASSGPGERQVVIPRRTILAARADIPYA